MRRAAVDTSVLAGPDSRLVLAAVATRYVRGFWSHWISQELARFRIARIGERAVKEGWDIHETRQQQLLCSIRINRLINHLTAYLEAVDYGRAPEADLSWLTDEHDRPVMQTALAAGADTLVTADYAHFPIGEERNGIHIVDPRTFLDLLYEQHPEARADIVDWLLLSGPPQSSYW